MSDDPSTASREAQYRRAREVLEGAGWLFEAFVAAEQRAWLATSAMDQDRREHHYARAHVASEMKALLEALIEAHQADLKLKERRDSFGRPQDRRQKEGRDGR